MLELLLTAALALPPASLAVPVGAPVAQPAAPLGPPGLCFPFPLPEGARSLPFGDGAFSVDPLYDRARLVDDVLDLLAATDDPLVHAETLRRAIAYVGQDGPDDSAPGRAARRALHDSLRARLAYELHRFDADVVEGRRPADDRTAALLAFDAGFYQGAAGQFGLPSGSDTRALLERAVELQPERCDLIFAAAMGGFEDLRSGEFERWVLRGLDAAPRPDGLGEVAMLRFAKVYWRIEDRDALRRRLEVELG